MAGVVLFLAIAYPHLAAAEQSGVMLLLVVIVLWG